MNGPAPKRDTRRLDAAGNLATGGALIGAASAGSYVNDRALERKGLDRPVKTAVKRGRLRPAHARYAAGKLGVRALQVTGIPLAAYGAYNLVKPDHKVHRVSPKDDVLKPLAHGATFIDARNEHRKRVSKEALTVDESKKLVRRKRLGRDLSLVGGTLGASALALRSPEIARAIASRSKRLAATRPVKRLAGMEPKATKLSNTLGIAAIGSGSVGSFNYASQQRLEAKQIKKGLQPYAFLDKIGRVRVTGMHAKDMFNVVDSKDTKRLVHRSRLQFVKTPGKRKPQGPTQLPLPFEKKLSPQQLSRAKARARAAGRRYPNAYDNMVSGGADWKVNKRDDKFLRQNRDRISPDAERGYNSLRRQRNTDRAWAATQGGLTAVNAAGTVAALRMRSKPWALIGGAATGFSASQAVRHGRKARGYDKGPMEGIRRKAKQREAAGLYGPGRGMEPVDTSSKRVNKGLIPRLPMPRSVPKGMLRTPGIRRSYVARKPGGKLVSVRGGFG